MLQYVTRFLLCSLWVWDYWKWSNSNLVSLPWFCRPTFRKYATRCKGQFQVTLIRTWNHLESLVTESKDFLYLPIDFQTQACLGYAFVNLVDSGEAGYQIQTRALGNLAGAWSFTRLIAACRRIHYCCHSRLNHPLFYITLFSILTQWIPTQQYTILKFCCQRRCSHKAVHANKPLCTCTKSWTRKDARTSNRIHIISPSFSVLSAFVEYKLFEAQTSRD